MARFSFTMNMPAKNGNSVHQVVADHPSASLDDIKYALSEHDFLNVEEMYRDLNGDYYSKGRILLNYRHIGKVKIFDIMR